MKEKNTEPSKALILINPVAGFINAKVMKRLVSDHFSKLGWDIFIHLTEKDGDLNALVKSHLERGIDLVVVAGGDGTIASVAAAMVDSDIPIGIIPSDLRPALTMTMSLFTSTTVALTILPGLIFDSI